MSVQAQQPVPAAGLHIVPDSLAEVVLLYRGSIFAPSPLGLAHTSRHEPGCAAIMGSFPASETWTTEPRMSKPGHLAWYIMAELRSVSQIAYMRCSLWNST